MNPVPPSVFPTGSYPVDGYLEILTMAGLVAFMVMLGIFAWSVLHSNQESERFVCPVRLRRIRAVFRLDDDGRRVDVLRCSVFRRRAITCGKPCVHTG